MEWSKEETLRLIESYRKQDLIWNSSHRDYFNKLRKQSAWEEISGEMMKPAGVCKKKMEYLLSALRREKMKMRKGAALGKGGHNAYKSSWFAVDSMRFLWERNKSEPRARTATTEHVDSPAESSVKVEDETLVKIEEELPPFSSDMSLEEDSTHSTPNTTCPQPPIFDVKQLKTSGDQVLNKAFEILTASADQNKDECYHFGNFVASKLRAYDTNVRCAIQNDILNLFLRANLGYYNNIEVVPGHGFENKPSTSGDSSVNGVQTPLSQLPHNPQNYGQSDVHMAATEPSPSFGTSITADDVYIPNL